MKEEKAFSYRRYVWRRFKKNKPALVSLYILIFLSLVAILAPVIANEYPLYIRYKGHHLFPAFSNKSNYIIKDHETGEEEKIQLDLTDWKQLDAGLVVWPLITYSPGKSDRLNGIYTSPAANNSYVNSQGDTVVTKAKFRHWLGTGKFADDVASGLIHGTRISLTIGIASMLIASLIGLFLGSVAGYYGDDGIKMKLGQWIGIFPGLLLGYFYAFQVREYTLRDAINESSWLFMAHFIFSLFLFMAILAACWGTGTLLSKLSLFSRSYRVPADGIISRLIEILTALPKIILIITIAAIATRSMLNVILIIGFTYWTGIARLVRAETLRVKHLDYVQAARAGGLSPMRIISRHALPNTIGPAFISIAFGVASAILAESSLSFLNIGVPDDIVTWGKLLSAGKENYKAWWLVVFPGLAIFITVTAYNLIGEGLRDALDPKLKQDGN